MNKYLRRMILLISVLTAVFLMGGVAYGATELSSKNTTVTVTSYYLTYTGEEIEPSVRVKATKSDSYYTTTLSEGKDYTLSYSNNVNAGEATVTVTGIGDYTGSVSQSFTIGQASIYSGTTISAKEETYTGRNITPDITLTSDGKTLKENVDYTLEQISAKDVGSYSVSVNGIGNYKGSRTVYFKIVKKPLSECTVSIDDQKYTGKALKPAITVYNGSVTVPSSEYSVTYSNNTEIGTAKVTISAAYSSKNYKGSGTGSFKIKYDIANCSYTIGNCTYTGAALTPEITIKKDSKTLTKGVDYTVQVSDNINAGKGTIQITGIGYYIGTATKKFTIEPRSIGETSSTLLLPEDKYVYTGEAFTPDVEVKDGATTLVKDRDYTLTYKKNVNPGYAYAVLTGKGNYGKTKKLKFAIYPATPKITKIEVSSKDTVTVHWKKEASGLKHIVYRNGKKIGTSKKDATYFKDTQKRTNGNAYVYTVISIPSGAKSLESEMSEEKSSYYLKAPKLNVNISGNRMLTASWSKNKKADAYQIQWSTSANFSSKKTAVIKDYKTLKKTFKKLTVGRKYYFRIRAYKTVTEEYEVIKATQEIPSSDLNTTMTTEIVGTTVLTESDTEATTLEPEKEIKTKKVKYYSSWSNTVVKVPITATAQSAAS